MKSRRDILRFAPVTLLGLSVLGACGSEVDAPGGYAFPKQRPSSDDYMSPEDREKLRQKVAAEKAERESQQAQQATPASGG
ncbi:MAG: hypothetical protein OXG64_01065 [Chloroflexi bacterium]|nr:hypothetical protein [Chloroflexota bacterium]